MQFFSDLFCFPNFGRGVFSVWMRNFTYFRYTIWVSFFWTFFEPSLYLFAMGYGLGSFIDEVEGQSYMQFFAPALMAVTAMFIGYFESAYSGYTKLVVQKTFNSILLTPVSASEIGVGEILWGASKSFFAVMGVVSVVLSLGILDFTYLIPVLFVLALTSWLFSSFGLLMATYARNYDWFIYGQSGVIIPMSLFSGTYFPLNELPSFMLPIAYSFPLTHSVMAVRSILSGQVSSMLAVNLSVLICFSYFFTNLAVARLERKITL